VRKNQHATLVLLFQEFRARREPRSKIDSPAMRALQWRLSFHELHIECRPVEGASTSWGLFCHGGCGFGLFRAREFAFTKPRSLRHRPAQRQPQQDFFETRATAVTKPLTPAPLFVINEQSFIRDLVLFSCVLLGLLSE
jgi:hypothetical protein